MSVQGATTIHAQPGCAAYDSEDLRYLSSLLEEILADLGERDARLADPSAEKDLEGRLAAALFDNFRPGRRDGLRLKRLALEKVVASAAAGL